MSNPTYQERLSEILAGMYGIGVGMTPKKVLIEAHKDSLVMQEINEATEAITSLMLDVIGEDECTSIRELSRDISYDEAKDEEGRLIAVNSFRSELRNTLKGNSDD